MLLLLKEKNIMVYQLFFLFKKSVSNDVIIYQSC